VITDKIYLVGFMASGKSTIARALAARLRWRAEDVDDLIEARERSTIAQIFATQGEPYFRAVEREILALLRPIRQIAVATGGGTFAEYVRSSETKIVRKPAELTFEQAAAIPVAAPSANLFSRPSPTRAAHVLEDLDGRIDLVLDGGPTWVGVESTVLDLTGEVPTVLRPGAVTLDMLRTVLPAARMRGDDSRDSGPQRSPGLLSRHYAPRAPLTLYDGPSGPALERLAHDAREARAAGRRVGVLVADDDALPALDVLRPPLGAAGDANAIAARLYAALRELDAAGVDEILARAHPVLEGLGDAIGDRLRRAAAGRVIRCG